MSMSWQGLVASSVPSQQHQIYGNGSLAINVLRPPLIEETLKGNCTGRLLEVPRLAHFITVSLPHNKWADVCVFYWISKANSQFSSAQTWCPTRCLIWNSPHYFCQVLHTNTYTHMQRECERAGELFGLFFRQGVQKDIFQDIKGNLLELKF